MNTLILIGADLVAISVLALGLYFRRHRRRDLVVAFFGVNIGVLAVSLVLAAADAGLGIGLGLFGVLSIIRLRSTEISQREVAYYFASLALGLVAGIAATTLVLPLGLMAMIVGALWIGDHPLVLPRARRQSITLDRAIADENELRSELAALLGSRIDAVTVIDLDLVRDLTIVDVRYRVSAAKPAVPLEPATPATATLEEVGSR